MALQMSLPSLVVLQISLRHLPCPGCPATNLSAGGLASALSVHSASSRTSPLPSGTCTTTPMPYCSPAFQIGGDPTATATAVQVSSPSFVLLPGSGFHTAGPGAGPDF